MSWICVHEKVQGPKLRKFAKLINCSHNEALGILVAFWLWCGDNTGNDGLIKGADEQDIVGVLSNGNRKGLDPLDILDALVNAEFLDVDEDGYVVHDWYEWQYERIRLLSSRNRDNDRKKLERQRRRETKDVTPTPPPKKADVQQEPDPPKEKAKPKKKYADFVTMTEEEYQSLLHQFGEAVTLKAIEVLDNYKGANGKKYKSDYRAILNWVIDRVRANSPDLFRKKVQTTPGNPFDKFTEGVK